VADTPRPIAVVDIDGVVADVRHRLHHVTGRRKDWGAFFAAARDDPPLPEGIARVRELMAEHDIVYVTGRPERCRRDTTAWLDAQRVGGRPLQMRRDTDRRPAKVMKLGVVRRLAESAPVAVVVDDDPEVCAVLRTAGYRVERADWMTRPAMLQVAQEVEGRT
jgi:hypothetical protein